MVTIKYRNDMGLTKAVDIKKRWQKYTEELYKNDLLVYMGKDSKKNGDAYICS